MKKIILAIVTALLLAGCVAEKTSSTMAYMGDDGKIHYVK